jgi:hypothetical protein
MQYFALARFAELHHFSPNMVSFSPLSFNPFSFFSFSSH